MIDVDKLLKEGGGLHKFGGIAPEGFTLIHEKTLEDLKNSSIWTSWVEGKITLLELNKKHFNNLV